MSQLVVFIHVYQKTNHWAFNPIKTGGESFRAQSE